jgi:hypothetical protein
VTSSERYPNILLIISARLYKISTRYPKIPPRFIQDIFKTKKENQIELKINILSAQK